jgi:hypothetical protein
MRFLPTRVHGLLDYAMGALLVVAPWIFGFADDAGGAATWVPVVLGLGVIGYSLLTDYELGLARKIPMPTHLMLDLGGGVLLAASPWLFGFADEVWVPHLVFGVLEVGAALVTRKHPADERVVERRAGLA